MSDHRAAVHRDTFYLDFLCNRFKIYHRQPRVVMSTRKTSIEIDQELLDEVRNVLGTDTLKETVEQAFREVLRERARREEVQALSTMRGMELDDPEVMARAWRS